MGFGVSYESVAFLIGIAVILFAESESIIDRTSYQQSKPFYLPTEKLQQLPTNTMFDIPADNKTPTPLKSTPESEEIVAVQSNDPAPFRSKLRPVDPNPLPRSLAKQVKCESLKQGYFVRLVADILSPEIFSQADPFRYLVDKTMTLNPYGIVQLRNTLTNHLQNDEFPRCYVPYAKALSSLLRCWPDVYTVEVYMSIIRKVISKNDADLSFLPPNISLPPQLLQLFSGEIFGDPAPPRGFFYKLILMPKSDLLILQAQLQKFTEQTKGVLLAIPSHQRFYIWYAEAAMKFLTKNESAIDELKRDMSEIQRLATSGQLFSPAKSTVQAF